VSGVALTVVAAKLALEAARRARAQWASTPIGELAGCGHCDGDCAMWDNCELRMALWKAQYDLMRASAGTRRR
jgi:hypothetical protein